MTLLGHARPGLLAAAGVLAWALLASCGGGAPAASCTACAPGVVDPGGEADAAPGGTDGGASVAGGAGSGGTGIDGGVGSGGTGATAEAVGIGATDGFGSIIVNGVRHDIGSASLDVADPGGLQLGMTVRVRGRIDSTGAEGTATVVVSAPELRGPARQVDTAGGSFSVSGTRVSTDPATAWAGLHGPADLTDGLGVQVYGLPGAPGQLRATRVERHADLSTVVLTGTVQDLPREQQQFRLGGRLVRYTAGALSGELTAAGLAEGLLVRVTAPAAAEADGALLAQAVAPWHTRPGADGQRLNLSGLVSGHDAARPAFRLLGVEVDASAAPLTGGPAHSLGNGVRVEVDGVMRQGMLRAERLHLRHAPGDGGPAQFSARGRIGHFVGAHDFRVQGQPVDASGAAVRFAGGSAADLANGRRVRVSGSRVSDGKLLAEEVFFEP